MSAYKKIISLVIVVAVLLMSDWLGVPVNSGTPISDPVPAVSDGATDTYAVTRVIDGDTIDVDIDGTIERIRMIGINTPETVDPRKPVECFGREASDYMKKILSGQRVRLESDDSQGDRDRYGRLLRYVILPDGTNVNLALIQEGYAYEYTYDSAYKYQTEFKRAQVDAEGQARGLWGPVCQ